MRIAILGTGNVGSALARGWSRRHHDVVLGSRDPTAERTQRRARELGLRIVLQAEAVREAEVVVLAVPWPAVQQTLHDCGDLRGRVLIDCTNPLTRDLAGLATDPERSAAERIATLARGARVVKAFNTTGAANLENPRYGGRGLAMLIAGDDAAAKETVMQLASDLGFEPVDFGTLDGARYLEPLAFVWIRLAYQCGLGTDFALDVVRRS
jgi:NADPH-dependent F420 reductase